MTDKENNNENNSILENLGYEPEYKATGVDKAAEDLLGNTVNPDSIKNFHIKTDNNKLADDNLYYQTTADTKDLQKVNSEDWNQTGSGYSSATGTYSWENKGTNQAQTQYQSDLETQRSNYIQSKQNSDILGTAVTKQKESDMQQYVSNQEAEKVGWAGGYVLDQTRQNEYLKASIQAQLYGAMELQKYGYNSALAAARLSYDLNQQEYAQKYYESAVSMALEEAQTTGIYFSAEVKDMLSQLSTANSIVADTTSSTADVERANKIINQIENWFSENKISKEGVKTSAKIAQDIEIERTRANDLYNRYMAAKESLGDDIDDSTTFFKLDENGEVLFNGTDVESIDFTNCTKTDALEYAATSSNAYKQLTSYFNYLVEAAISAYKAKNTTTDSAGKTTSTVTNVGINNAISTAISNQIKTYLDEINKTNLSAEDKQKISTLINSYTYSSIETNTTFDINAKGTGDGSGSEDDNQKDNDIYNSDGTYKYTDPTNSNYAKYIFQNTTTDTGDVTYQISYKTGSSGGNKNFYIKFDEETSYEMEMSGVKVNSNNSHNAKIPSTEGVNDGEIRLIDTSYTDSLANRTYSYPSLALIIFDGSDWRYVQVPASKGTDNTEKIMLSLLNKIGCSNEYLKSLISTNEHDRKCVYITRAYDDGSNLTLSKESLM